MDLSDWRLDLQCLVFLIWKMREFDKLLMKESCNIQQFNIYWIIGNFLEKIILRKLYALNFKWLLRNFRLLEWGNGQVVVKSWKLQQKYGWQSVIWWPHQHDWSICIYIRISETDSKWNLRKGKWLQTSSSNFKGNSWWKFLS